MTLYNTTVTFIWLTVIFKDMQSIRSTENLFYITTIFTFVSVAFGEPLRLLLRLHYQEWWAVISILMLAMFIDIVKLLNHVLVEGNRVNGSLTVLRKSIPYQMEK